MHEALGGMRIWQRVEVLARTELTTLQQSLLLIYSDYLPDHHQCAREHSGYWRESIAQDQQGFHFPILVLEGEGAKGRKDRRNKHSLSIFKNEKSPQGKWF